MSYPPPPGYGQQPGYGGGFPPPSPGFGGYGAPVQNQSNGLAIGALVCGICSIFICMPVGLIAIPLGIAGLSRAKKINGNGRGLAIGGIVTGLIGTLIGVALLFVFVWAADQVDEIVDFCGSDSELADGTPCERQGTEDPTPNDGDGVNSDPVDNVCNVDRYFEDPDC